MEQLAPEQLRRTYDPQTLPATGTEHVAPLTGIIGQERAVAALQFGLDIRDIGFNVYVAGPPGIGKMTAVQSFLEHVAARQPVPPDWCYVQNYADSYKPRALALPAGRGRQLQQDMRDLVEHARREIPKAFEGEGYGAKRDTILRDLEHARSQEQDDLSQKAAQAGFVLQAQSSGVLIIPVLKGRPLKENEFAALPASIRADLDQRRDALEGELKAAMKQIRNLERAAQDRIGELDRQVMLYVVGGLMEDLHEKYRDLPEVLQYLEAAQQDILENLELFKGGAASRPPAPEDGSSAAGGWQREQAFRKYQVNLFVDNGRSEGAPVILELNPTYTNLFGRIEKETLYGTLTTDLTLIKPGALHRANGGYLILQIEDLLRDQYSWDSLKRALRSRKVEMEELGERLGYVATRSMRPGPIPLDLKVVLIGSPAIYYTLQNLDEGFPELFKVKADFDTLMPATPANVDRFIEFVAMLCEKDKLRPVDAAGLSCLLEHSARMAEDQNKLSTHFGVLANLIREANYWAGRANEPIVGEAHVRRALDQRIFRSNLVEERIREMMARGLILLDTHGEKVGQVNGLAVIQLGDYAFGRPNRITASVGPGREGIVDIEREVELGGPLYSKGVLILGGFLAQRFAQAHPLSLAARLVFEQSYEGIEGDSASSAELYALLSALSGLPIRQEFAVTGSVDQQGEVQAIGGVNEKIEGFFEVCCARGLTGEQGVLIPRSNMQNLQLRPSVVEAVRRGQFQIWAVSTIDEGIELLTRTPAGSRDPEGRFPAGSVNSLVEARLSAYADAMREFAHS